MADVTGAMLTTNVLSDQIAIDLSDSISQLEPSVQPLTVFTRRARKTRASATKFSWLEEESKPRFLATEGTALVGATTINVEAGQGAYVQQWDLLLNTRTGEVIRVNSVATDALGVTRGVGSTAAAINDADELMLIGSAQPENDTSKPARSDIPNKITNYTQIFRTPYEVSGSLQASSFQVAPAEWPRQARNKAVEHAKDIEYAMLHGRKSLSTPGATELRTMGGLHSFITTNQTDAGGDLSEAEFNAFMLQVMRYGSDSKLAMASGVGVSALNKFPASKQQTRNDETTYGMNVTHYTSPFGSLNLVYHRMLEGSKYGGWITVVDLDNVAYRFLANDEVSRDTKVLQNRQPNDQDGRKDEILTEASLEVDQEQTHGLLTGITS
jgi:hypothetical protein